MTRTFNILGLLCLLLLGAIGGAGAQAVYVPLASTQIISTSASGCVSDADLSIGSTVFGTDNAAKIQAILTKGAASPIEVVIDGKYSVGTTLLVYSNTRIHINPGCGLIARNGLNAPVLQNANLAWSIQTGNTAVPAAGIDHDIVIDGGGIINGNAAGQVKWLGWSNSTSTSTQTAWTTSTINGKSVKVATGGWTVPLRFWGVNGLTLSGIKIYMPRTFAAHFADVYRVMVDNCAVDVGSSSAYNYDGFHFDGPCRYISGKSLITKTQDDGFALNADDGYLQPDGQTPSLSYSSTVTQGYGPITDVSLQGLTFADSAFGIRILSGASRVDRISLSDIKGRTTNQWLILDNYAESPGMVLNNGTGNFGSVSVDGADVTISAGGYKNTYIYLSAAMESLRIRNINRSDFATAVPTLIADTGASIDVLAIDGFTSRDAVGVAIPLIDIKGSIGLLSVRNATQRIITGTPSQPLVKTETGSVVGRILLSGIAVDHAANVISVSGGTISSIQGAGISHTNSGGGATILVAAGTVPKITVSNYDGALTTGVSGSGVITAQSGDGFGGTLTGGNLTASAGNASAVITATGISGGLSPVSSVLYRSLTTGFTPPGTGTVVSGASPWADTGLTNGTPYYYRMLSTDSSTTPQTALSAQISVTPALALAKSTFVAANGTDLAAYVPVTGSNWTKVSGAWAIQNNSAVMTGTLASNNWVALVNAGSGTRTQTVKWTPTYSNGAEGVQLWAFSNAAATTGVIFIIYQGKVEVYSTASGSATLVSTFTVTTAPSALHTAVITGTATSMTLNIDGTSIGTVTPTAPAGTYFGMGVSGVTNGTTPSTTFQSFEVD